MAGVVSQRSSQVPREGYRHVPVLPSVLQYIAYDNDPLAKKGKKSMYVVVSIALGFRSATVLLFSFSNCLILLRHVSDKLPRQ